MRVIGCVFLLWASLAEAQTIELATNTVGVCEELEISFADFPVTASAKGNWVTIAEVGAAPWVHTFRDLYLPIASSGTVALSTRGLDPEKHYEVRAYEDWSATKSWDIVDSQAFFLTSTGCKTPWVEADQDFYFAGQDIEVTFGDFLGPSSNWITLARPEQPNWKYEKFSWLPSAGPHSLSTAGLAPGLYEIRVFEDWARTKDSYIMDRKTIELRDLSFPIATEDVRMGHAVTGGSGCPEGSVSQVASDDGATVSLFFDSYEAETSDERLRRRAQCNIAIPVVVPLGHRPKAFTVDFRGYTDIPDGGTGTFSCRYGAAGHAGQESMTIPGPFEDDITVSHVISAPGGAFACGESFTLSIASAIDMARGAFATHDAYGAFDTADAAHDSAIVMSVETEPCQ